MKSFFTPRKLVIFLFFLGFLAYSNALKNQLFWDDNDGIVNNNYIKDWHYWRNYFSENLIAGAGLQSNYWRPLLLVIFSIQWKIWGLWPAGFHLISIIIHLLVSFLFFRLIFTITKNHWFAFWPALFFLIHPLQTEAVTYVSGLADPLSAVFLLIALLWQIKYPQEKISWPICLFFVLALLSKEKSLLVFPTLLFLLRSASFFEKETPRQSIPYWKNFFLSQMKYFWPILVIGTFYVLLRITSLNFQNTLNLYDDPSNVYANDISVRAWTFFKIFPQYLGLIFWPFHLHMERIVTIETSFFSWPVIFGFLCIFIMFIRLFLLAIRNRLAFFALGWFLFTLLASSGIPAVSSGIMYEHYLYLPLAGFFLWLASEIFFYLEKKNRLALTSKLNWFLLLLTIFWIALTIQRNVVWKTPISLYEDILQYNQKSLRVWNNLGMAYADNNQIEEAIFAYRKAIQLDPKKSSTPPRHNLANSLNALGYKEEATKFYQEALAIDPDFVFSYAPLAEIFIQEKEYDCGLDFFSNLRQHSKNYRWEIDRIIASIRQAKSSNHE